MGLVRAYGHGVRQWIAISLVLELALSGIAPSATLAAQKSKFQFVSYLVWTRMTDRDRKSLVNDINEISRVAHARTNKRRSALPASIRPTLWSFLQTVQEGFETLSPIANARAADAIKLGSSSSMQDYSAAQDQFDRICTGGLSRNNPSETQIVLTCSSAQDHMDSYQRQYGAGGNASGGNASGGGTGANTGSNSTGNSASARSPSGTLSNPSNYGNSVSSRSQVMDTSGTASSGSQDNAPSQSNFPAGEDATKQGNSSDENTSPATGQNGNTAIAPTGGSTGNSNLSGGTDNKSDTADTGDLIKGQKLRGDRDQWSEKMGRESNNDPCRTSAALGQEYSCGSTVQKMRTVEMTQFVTQQIGGMGAQVAGMNANYQAQQSGSMSGALQASGKAQMGVGMAQMGMGMATAAMGAMEVYWGTKHSRNADTFAEKLGGFNGKNDFDVTQSANKNTDGTQEGQDGYVGIKGDNELAAKVIGSDPDDANFGDMNAAIALKTKVPGATAGQTQDPNLLRARENEIQTKQKMMASEIHKVGDHAFREQDQIASDAKMTGAMTIARGAGQMIQAAAQMYVAKANLNAAKQIEAHSNNPFNFTPPPGTPAQYTTGDPLAPRPPTAIGSGNSGTTDGSSAADSTDPNAKTADLGPPTTYQRSPNGMKDAPPPAAVFKPGDPSQGGGGGGGGGSMGGGSTSASTDKNEEPAPRMADSRGAPPYEGGGAYGGGGKGGAGGDKGPDLSGLLAAFLPKKDEEGHKNGILDYGGRRTPGSEGNEDASLLDRNINIFERVHQAYQDKQKRRRVGI